MPFPHTPPPHPLGKDKGETGWGWAARFTPDQK
jgi:hypothetical protein